MILPYGIEVSFRVSMILPYGIEVSFCMDLVNARPLCFFDTI